jgi:hypothetical protein
MEDKIMQIIKEDEFFCPNETGFYDKPQETFNAIKKLVDKGLIRKRNCLGLAYELNKQ